MWRVGRNVPLFSYSHIFRYNQRASVNGNVHHGWSLLGQGTGGGSHMATIPFFEVEYFYHLTMKISEKYPHFLKVFVF